MTVDTRTGEVVLDPGVITTRENTETVFGTPLLVGLSVESEVHRVETGTRSGG